MFELMFTSFPVLIRYWQLKKRGEALTVWNMKTAVFLWAVLAFTLFLIIFYFHPKTYASIVPFRTVSVVAQTSGPVTEIAVSNGQRVSVGDLLFRIEDSAQRAALRQAEAELRILDAKEAQAGDDRLVAQAQVDEIQAQLRKLEEQLADAQELAQRGLASQNTLLDTETAVAAAQADLDAALAQLDLAEITVGEGILAERNAALAAIESAKTQLGFTEVRSFVDGTVTQLALSLGSPATTLVFSPAMVIIPDRVKDEPVRIVAGFHQVSRNVLYDHMPVEVACEPNANILFQNAIFPGRISSFQPAVATGQVTPDGQLLEAKRALERGTVQAFIELLHPEHEAEILDGAGCIVQAYSNDIHGFWGHLIGVTGVVKAGGLRLKVLGTIITGAGLAGGGH
ncbi:MAG: biotin/lipoyl-binding protein [Pseudomonadota bacterium]